MSSLARWVSVFFDSSVLSLFIFPAIGWKVAGWQGVAWSLLALFILTGIPLAYILIGMRRGWVSDLELSHREERPRFILVSISSDILALLILSFVTISTLAMFSQGMRLNAAGVDYSAITNVAKDKSEELLSLGYDAPDLAPDLKEMMIK